MSRFKTPKTYVPDLPSVRDSGPEREPEFYGTSYGLHGGGGNEALRDYGIALQSARERSQYSRDNTWLESIIPTIEGRSNIIQKIIQAKEGVSGKIGQRMQEKDSLKSQMMEAEKGVETAEAIRITAPEKTYGYSWAPYGLYNNEYQYQQANRTVVIEGAKARVRELENLGKNYEQDIEEAQNLLRLLGQYEKEKKFEFLNQYEARSSSGFIDAGGTSVPAITPTGSLRYKQRSNKPETGIGFQVPQMPFEQKPLSQPPKKYFRGENVADKIFSVPKDTMMGNANRSFKSGQRDLDFGRMTSNDGMQTSDKAMMKSMKGDYKNSRFNARRFFG